MDYKLSVLPNGLRVVTQYMPEAVSFALGVCVNAGSRNDFPECYGLAHFVEHSVFRRTKQMNSKDISEAFENVGAYSNAYTTKESICFYARGLKEYFRKILNLMYDITIEPVFDDEDIDKERAIIIEEIKSYYDDPEDLIIDFGDAAIYKNSDLEHPILGNKNNVRSIKTADIQRFHSEFFKPDNMLISCVGNIKHEEVISAMEENFAKVASPHPTVKPYTSLPEFVRTSQVLRKDYAQNHFLYCSRVCNFASEDRFPLMALNFILGDGVSSRLNQRIREQLGLVYTVYSSLQCFSDSGVWSIYAGSDSGKISKITDNIENEITKLTESHISGEELSRAKVQLKSATVMAVENLSNFMQDIAKSLLLTGKSLGTDETIAKINAISNDDIVRVTDKYLRLDKWSEIIFKIY